MSKAVDSIDEYAMAIKLAMSSFCVFNSCSGETDNECMVLEQLKSIYVANMVNNL